MKVLVKAIAGSHLFGTNTPKSDMDYKGVYLPSREDILLGTAKPSINIKTNNTGNKNTSEDVDYESYSLAKFMKMLHEGQTGAIELLWTPDHLIIERSEWWDYLQRHREELLHNKVTAFVAYCKTQADKYGVKGSRMGAVKKTLETLNKIKEFHVGTTKLVYVWDRLLDDLLDKVEHVSFSYQDNPGGRVYFIEVCDRKFQESVTVDYAIDALTKIYDNYGHRARQAESNDGVDFKALSHAYRVCCQAQEILEDHKLTLPLKGDDRNVVKMIKNKELPFNYVKELLESKLELVAQAQAKTELPTDFDTQKWCKNFVMDVYQEHIEETRMGL